MRRLTLYVVCDGPGQGSVSAVDPGSGTAVVPIPCPWGQSAAVTPDGRRVLVPNGQPGTVTPIRTWTNVALGPIPVGAEPYPIVVTPNSRRAYVGNTSSSSVTAIRLTTGTVMATIPVGNVPARLALTPDGRTLYALNATDNTIATTVGS